jgi:ABC-2 type transport system ATP-binding protein
VAGGPSSAAGDLKDESCAGTHQIINAARRQAGFLVIASREAGMAEQPAILAEGLGKRFGQLQALAGVDLQVPAGAMVALLGPNGAGKTTTVRILCTLLLPDAGRAEVAGLDVVRQAAAVRRVIGLSGQYAAVDAYLTGRENLRMIGRLSGLSRGAARSRADELLQLFGLAGAAGRTARTYSGGMRRRLDVAASLVAAPRVLFLDEPTTGLDPRGRIGLWALLAELTGQGTSLLLTTQYLEEADRLADAIVVIDTGQVIATGTSAELKAQVGGDRLEVQALPGDDLARLAAALAGLGSRPPALDPGLGRLVIPVAAGGPGVLPEVAARLSAAGLRIADLTLRRPTLDDVFLTLTGQPSAPPAAGQPGDLPSQGGAA